MWKSDIIMMNGELMPYADASIHPLSLAVTYATTVFEGVACLSCTRNQSVLIIPCGGALKTAKSGHEGDAIWGYL